ncbi:MAG: zinc ribbon domain-containing protein [Desulfobacterales bacterium]|nr:zinc ribbon domain-containing protein [Desulfobacterales bacterium]
MPLYEYLCKDCGKTNEILIFGSENNIICNSCGSGNLKKLLSAHSAMSGLTKHSLPGHGDTSCCGSSPVTAGCAGPGSCCGKNAGL